jgi:dynein heavy chain
LNRPIIQDELEKKHAVLLDMYKQDLKIVQTIFLEGKQLIDRNDEKSPIYNNYPPVAGTLTWCRTLKDRISEPFKKIDSLGKGITEREEYKDVDKLYQNILKIIKDYEESKIGLWEKEVDESTHEKLKHFLITYDESSENKENGLLKVNFDPILVRLLREVKYLKQLDRDVPETASKLFEKADIYRRQVVSLELIIQNYNRIVTCLNDVEEPLVKERIVRMNKDIEPGIKEFKWESPGIDNFIKEAKKTVDDLYEIVDKMKKSLDSIYSELAKLKKPMIERKNKPISPEEYDNILKAAIANKLLNVKDCGTAVHKLLKEINDAVKFDKKKPEWKKYTEYINTIVTDGICEGIVFALDHLNEQINSEKMDQPQLFEIKLELEGKRGVVYEPEILESEGGLKSVCDTIKGWIN